MSLFSNLVSAEGLLRVFQIIAIAAGLVAVVALIGKDVTNNIVAGRRAKELLALQKDVADARRKQAEAETRLEEVRRIAAPRELFADKFKAVLADKPTGSVAFQYKKDDSEAHRFTLQIYHAFSDLGWKAYFPAPQDANPPDEFSKLFPAVRSGVTILWKPKSLLVAPPSRTSDPMLWALVDAFDVSGFNALFESREIPDEYDFIILVGAKQ